MRSVNHYRKFDSVFRSHDWEGAIGIEVAAALSLDRFQAVQIMVSRPIVSASIIGWLVGDLGASVPSGLLFELL